MSADLQLTISATGAAELSKLFENLEKVTTAATKLAGSGKSLEELRKSIVAVGKTGSAFSELSTSIRSLEAAAQGLPTQLLTAMKGIGQMPTAVKTAYDKSIAEVKSGGSRMKSAVRQEIAELQAEYERMSGLGARFKVKALQNLRTQGVSLFPDDRQLLADYLRDQRKLETALKRMDQESAERIAEARNARSVSLARGKDAIKGHIQALKLESDAKLLAEKAEADRYLNALKKMAEQQALRESEARNARAVSLARGKDAIKNHIDNIRAENNAKLLAERAEALRYARQLEAIQKEQVSRETNARFGGRLLGQMSNISTGRVFIPDDRDAAKVRQVSGAMQELGIKAGTAHSAVRGLASGFGLLWLTWGQVAPLLAGATVSHAFIQTVKQGAELEHTLSVIRVLGENTTEAMAGLRHELFEIARSGPFGPQQIANAMKTLSLAGLQANEILKVTRDVLNFSIAGDTSIEMAADTLVSVTTAFGTGADGFARASDVIAKTAAVSKASIESISESFKTASVVNAQYGVSLEDVGTGLAALAQLGIKGTAAGTSLRNMYADLSGRSEKVAKLLKQQGIEMRDAATGGFRDLVVVTGELRQKLQQMDAISQKNFLQALLGERGAKPMVELLRMIEQAPKSVQQGFQNALDEMQKGIKESHGFAAASAIELTQTTQNQMKAAGASLQAALTEAFSRAQPVLNQIFQALQDIFRDPSTVEFLRSIVTGIAQLGLTVVEHVKILGYAAAGWAASKLALKLLTTEAVSAKLGLTATTVAAAAAGTTSAAAAGGVGLLARSLALLGPVIAVATAAWMAYSYWKGQSTDTAKQAEQKSWDNTIAAIKADTEAVQERVKLLREGASTAAVGRIQEENTRYGKVISERKAQTQQFVNDELDALKKRDAYIAQYSGQANVVAYEAGLKSLQKAVDEKARIRAEAQAQEAADLAVLYRNRDAQRAAYQAEDEELKKRQPKATPTGIGKFDIAGASKERDFSRLKQFETNAQELLKVENDFHRRRMDELQRNFQNEKTLLDSQLKNKLITEADYYAESLAQSIKQESERAEEIKRHRAKAEEQLNAKLESIVQVGGPQVIQNAQLEPESAKFQALNQASAQLAAAYRKLTNEKLVLTQATEDELSKLSSEVELRRTLSLQTLQGGLKADADSVAKLARELEIATAAQERKADLAEISIDLTDRQIAANKAAEEFEQKYATRVGELNKLLEDRRSQLDSLVARRDSEVLSEVGNPEVVRELNNQIALLAPALAVTESELGRIKSMVERGSGFAAIAKDAEWARKEAIKLRDDIAGSIAESLMRGTQGFKSLWSSLVDWMKNSISNLVLQPILQPIVGSALGIGSGGASGALSGLANLLNSSGTGSLMGGLGQGLARLGYSLNAPNLTAFGAGVSQGPAAFGQLGFAGNAGVAANLAGNALAARGISQGISGGYSVTGGNTLNNIGALASLYFGPIAGAVTGAINRLFGRKFADTGISGTLGAQSSLQTYDLFKGGLFRSDKKEFGALSLEQEKALNTAASGILEASAAAAESLGVSGAAFKNFTKEIDISFGADGSKAQEAIAKAMEDFANDALASVFGNQLDPYRASGETLVETLTRLGAATKSVNGAFDSLGLSVEKIFSSGLAGAAQKSSLVDLFGGADQFSSSVGSFYQEFFSQTEKTTTGMRLLGAEFAKLNLGALPTTREEFKRLVLGFTERTGLMTEESQSTFASLINLSSAFAELVPAVDEASKSVKDLFESLDGIVGDFLSRPELAQYKAGRISSQLAESGINVSPEQVLASTKEDLRALWESLGVDGKLAIQEAYAAWKDLQDLLSETSLAAVYSSLDGIIDKVLSGAELASYKAGRISQQLAASGILVSDSSVLGATLTDVRALWDSLGNDGKLALQEVFSAWVDVKEVLKEIDVQAAETAVSMQEKLIDGFLKDLNVSGDELLSAYDEINPKSKNLVETWRATVDEIDNLESALQDLLGTKPATAIDTLRNTIEQRNGLKEVISGNNQTILDLRVGQGGQGALDALRRREAELWSEFASTKNPALASEITKVTLERVKLEAEIAQGPGIELAKKAREKEIEALKEQISNAEKLSDVAKEMRQTVLSLKAGDLSNLGFEQRLGAAKTLFQGALEKAQAGDANAFGDVQKYGQDYLQSAQKVYGGATKPYSDIFTFVTSAMDALAGQFGNAPTQTDLLQSQLDKLEAIQAQELDTSDEQIAALEDLNAQFGTVVTSLNDSANQQITLLNAQLDEMRATKEAAEAQITQNGVAYQRLLAELEALNFNFEALKNQNALAASAPII